MKDRFRTFQAVTNAILMQDYQALVPLRLRNQDFLSLVRLCSVKNTTKKF